MINKEFLKTLTILYVEDDDITREQFAKSLRRLFKNVILGCDGEDGYNKFQEKRLNSESIDMILSDINMPKMNGLEMLEKIRELDEDIPVMYTTARTETEFMQKAIELNVNHYALKPINLEDVILRIQKVCEKKYYQMIIDLKNKELKNYLTIIDNVAVIFKMNKEGEITFANDLFCEQFHQKQDSLIGQKFTSLLPSEISKNLSDEILATISSDKTWSGDIKYENHLKEIFYIRSTVFKLLQENDFEYINIGFLSTEEVEKKRNFHKSVLTSISNKSKETLKVKNDLESLLLENKKLKETSILFNTQIKKYQEKVAFFKNQILHYEKELSSVDEKIEKAILSRSKNLSDNEEIVQKAQKEKEILMSHNITLEENNLIHIKEIEKLKDTIVQKEKRIEAISEVLEDRESQIRKLKPDLLS